MRRASTHKKIGCRAGATVAEPAKIGGEEEISEDHEDIDPADHWVIGHAVPLLIEVVLDHICRA